MMKSKYNILALVILIAVLALFMVQPGCGGDDDDDDDVPPVLDDDDDDSGDDDDDDDDTAGDDTTPPGPPTVDPPVTPTFISFARISGVTEADAAIRVTGGAEHANAVADTVGLFCLHVPLIDGQTNALVVVAIDAAGNESNPTTVSVEQVIPEEDVNMSQGHPAEASSTSTGHPENSPDKAVDGDLGTRWDASENHPNPQWLLVNLEEFVKIKSITVNWNDDTNYATKYSIRTHHEEFVTTEPTDPSWAVVWSTEVGQGGDEEILFAEDISAYYVAIVMDRSNSGFPLYNGYEIDEFEVIGHPSTKLEECP